MSKRLSVLVSEAEYREVLRAARASRLTLAEWVRQALRSARRREPRADVKKKLEVVHAASRHSYPTGDVDQMLAEIERGYGGESPR